MRQVALRHRVDLEIGAERDREHPRSRGSTRSGADHDERDESDQQAPLHEDQDTPHHVSYRRSSSLRIAASSGARSSSRPSSRRNEVVGLRASAGSSSAVWLTLRPMPRTTRPSAASGRIPAIFRPWTTTSFGSSTDASSGSAAATASPASGDS